MRTSLLSPMTRLFGTAAACALVLPACSQVSAQPATTIEAPVQLGTSFQLANSSEGDKLRAITDAFDRFHADTGGWPLGEGVWTASSRPELKPTEFTVHDTALFVKPDSLPVCSTGAKPCWGGPYLSGGTSLADPAFNDQWGHPHLFAYYRPFDHRGGGTIAAPDGAALLWSRGPDGVDNVGCIEGRCARDDKKISIGQLSTDGDDIVVMLAKSTK